jgi:hypothetical protein
VSPHDGELFDLRPSEAAPAAHSSAKPKAPSRVALPSWPGHYVCPSCAFRLPFAGEVSAPPHCPLCFFGSRDGDVVRPMVFEED